MKVFQSFQRVQAEKDNYWSNTSNLFHRPFESIEDVGWKRFIVASLKAILYLLALLFLLRLSVGDAAGHRRVVAEASFPSWLSNLFFLTFPISFITYFSNFDTIVAPKKRRRQMKMIVEKAMVF